MAKFLYSIGSLAARQAWAFVLTWVLILAGIGGSYTTFKGALTDQISIPGTEAQQVQEQLQDTFGLNTNAASGQVIIQTDGGQPFTQEQKDALAAALAQISDLDGVSSVSDPFAIQAQLDEGRAKLDAAQAQLDEQAGPARDGQAQLTEAQSQLDAQRSELEAAGAPAEAFAQLDTAQAQLDEQGAPLTEALAQITAGQAEIDRNRELLELSAGASAVATAGATAIAGVTFDATIGSVAPETLKAARDTFEPLTDEGMTLSFNSGMEGVKSEMDSTAETIGIIVAFLILLVMLGSIVAAGLPILMALVGVGAASLGTLALSGLVDMTSTTLSLGTMLGLAVGIDYSLFILNRHRNNLARGMSLHHSIAMAVGTAGSAVAFAGITVMIALLALNVVGIPFLGVMGNAAAFSVLMAVAVALTLTPAVLSLIGLRVVGKKRRQQILHRQEQDVTATAEDLAQASSAAKVSEEKKRGWLALILKKPAVTILLSAALLGLLASPVSQMRLGLPGADSQPTDSSAYQTYQLMSQEFGEGRNGTLVVAASLPEGTTAEQATIDQLEVGRYLASLDKAAAVVPALIAEDRSALLFQVVPVQGPNSESTVNLVHTLRDIKVPLEQGESALSVTGQTAMSVDISQNLADVLPLYIAIVMGLSLLVLVLVFRSVLVPLTATIGFLFSLLAALGTTTAIFQWGWASDLFNVSTPGPLLAFLPILAVGILFGLAMDYQVFLVSGMREAYAHGRGARAAVVIGYNHNARVVVAAALIMAGVFLGFVFSGDPMIASIGFALAAGVLFDAFVVRMTLIPALLHLLGEAAWWFPRWLDKLIPDLDVEGTQLATRQQQGRDNTRPQV